MFCRGTDCGRRSEDIVNIWSFCFGRLHGRTKLVGSDDASECLVPFFHVPRFEDAKIARSTILLKYMPVLKKSDLAVVSAANGMHIHMYREEAERGLGQLDLPCALYPLERGPENVFIVSRRVHGFLACSFFCSCVEQGGAVYTVSGEDTVLGGISSFRGNSAVSPGAGSEHVGQDQDKDGVCFFIILVVQTPDARVAVATISWVGCVFALVLI